MVGKKIFREVDLGLEMEAEERLEALNDGGKENLP